MAKELVADYDFDPATREITINGHGSTFSKHAVTSVRNDRTKETYYTAAQWRNVSVTDNVLTLPIGVINQPARATDTLVIYFDAERTSPSVIDDGVEHSIPLIGPAATDAATTMALVNEIRTKLIEAEIFTT